jgi:transporter family protein
MHWLLAAVISAILAGSTSILSKCGVRKTDADVATSLRTVVVVIFSWIVVLAMGLQHQIPLLDTTSLLFLLLSGLATGISWIFNLKALALVHVNRADPINKICTVLTVLLGIFYFGEKNHPVLKVAGILLLSLGIFLMVEKSEDEKKPKNKIWLVYAFLGAIFAALTSFFAKIGLADVPSDLANAIRAIVILFIAWALMLAQGKGPQIFKVQKNEFIFIILSGLTTAASWLFYYYAIQKGNVSVVAPIDKMSVVIAIIFSRVFLKEPLSKKGFLGVILITAGTLVLTFST